MEGVELHDEDTPDEAGKPLRIVVCMSKESSRRLLRAQYVQSDIGFKRVIGFQEFELGGFDQEAQMSMFSFDLVSLKLLADDFKKSI